jgi:hypothetical protein
MKIGLPILWSIVGSFFVLLAIHKIYTLQDSYNDTENFIIKKSPIAGSGVFSNKFRLKDQALFKAYSKNKRVTVICKKLNHCWNPNSKLINTLGGWWLVATKDIAVGEEVTANYNHTPWFINKAKTWWTC